MRKSYVEWNSEHTELTLRRYVCSRQGYREEKYVKKEIKKRRPWDITRVGCPAKLVIALDRNTGQWYVKNFMLYCDPNSVQEKGQLSTERSGGPLPGGLGRRLLHSSLFLL